MLAPTGFRSDLPLFVLDRDLSRLLVQTIRLTLTSIAATSLLASPHILLALLKSSHLRMHRMQLQKAPAATKMALTSAPTAVATPRVPDEQRQRHLELGMYIRRASL